MPSKLNNFSDKVTPNSLKDVEVIGSLLKIFNSQFDIQEEISDNPTNPYTLDWLTKKFKETSNEDFILIKEEILKTNINEIWEVFGLVDSNIEIQDRYALIDNLFNLERDSLLKESKLEEYVDSQYMNSSSDFKHGKGNAKSFNYIYDLIKLSNLTNIYDEDIFRIKESEPLHYTVETSLYKEVYEQIANPLTHPVGFVYDFVRFVEKDFNDYFNIGYKRILANLIFISYTREDLKINTSTNFLIKTEEKIITPSDCNYDISRAGSDGTYTEKIFVEDKALFGSVKKFSTEINSVRDEKFVVDFYDSGIDIEALNITPYDWRGYGYRLVKDYDGSIKLFSKHDFTLKDYPEIFDDDGISIQPALNGAKIYSQIEDVRLVDSSHGDIALQSEDIIQGREAETNVVKSFTFKEYIIRSADFVDVEYKIFGYEDYVKARIPLLDKKPSFNKLYFDRVIFYIDDLRRYSEDYNGVLIEDFGLNAKLAYDFYEEYEVLTSDVTENVRDIREDVANLPVNSCHPLYNPVDGDGLPIAYEGPRNTLDNTLDDTQHRESWDNFARLAPENIGIVYRNGEYKKVPKFDEAQWVDYPLGHKYYPGRLEGYAQEKPEADLAIVESTTPKATYIRQNTEVEDNVTELNNLHYVAWEDRNEDRFDLLGEREKYNILTFKRPKYGQSRGYEIVNGERVSKKMKYGIEAKENYVYGSFFDDEVNGYIPSPYVVAKNEALPALVPNPDYDAGLPESLANLKDIKNPDLMSERYTDAEVYKALWNYGPDDYTKRNDDFANYELTYNEVSDTIGPFSDDYNAVIHVKMDVSTESAYKFLGNVPVVGTPGVKIGQAHYFIGAIEEEVAIEGSEIFYEDSDYTESFDFGIFRGAVEILDGNIGAL